MTGAKPPGISSNDGGSMLVQFEIKRIDLWSLFKISFILYAVVGVLAGFLMFFFTMVMGSLGGAFMEEEGYPGFPLIGGAMGFLLIPFLAFLYGVMGSVFATIGGWIFNVVCGMSGGLRFIADTYDTTPRAPARSYPPPPPPASGQGPPYSPGPGGQSGDHQPGGPGSGGAV
jgi:hypothetical protein